MNQQTLATLKNRQGFSLIEIIITLMVVGILSTMLLSVMNFSVTNSIQPIATLQQTMALQQTMENIKTNFSATPDLALLKVAIGTGSQNNSYGAYEVIENKYITFSAYTDVDGISSDSILKVSIKGQGADLVLTELFVE